jgi:hypothetical protein
MTFLQMSKVASPTSPTLGSRAVQRRVEAGSTALCTHFQASVESSPASNGSRSSPTSTSTVAGIGWSKGRTLCTGETVRDAATDLLGNQRPCACWFLSPHKGRFVLTVLSRQVGALFAYGGTHARQRGNSPIRGSRSRPGSLRTVRQSRFAGRSTSPRPRCFVARSAGRSPRNESGSRSISPTPPSWMAAASMSCRRVPPLGRRSGAVVIRSPSRRIQRLLDVTGVTPLFPIAQDARPVVTAHG